MVASPTRRVTAALVASAVAHVLLLAALGPGSTGGGGTAAAPKPFTLVARLVMDDARVPIAEPAPRRDTVPSPAPREARKPTPAPVPATPAEIQGAGVEAPDPVYYGVRQLDVYPAIAGGLDLRYPARAHADGVKGRVALLVLIDAHGAVADASVVDAQPPGFFEDDALRALRAARFQPARKGGRAVKSRLVIEINYGE